jgi:transcriptional regulator with XRE-family HTH domain
MSRTELKVFRVKRGLSQAQFAEKIEFSRGHYARFENGEAETTLRFLEALQTAFGLSYEEAKALMKRDNE